jgi:hypothetical protein
MTPYNSIDYVKFNLVGTHLIRNIQNIHDFSKNNQYLPT